MKQNQIMYKKRKKSTIGFTGKFVHPFNCSVSFIIPVDEGKEKSTEESDKNEEINSEIVDEKSTASKSGGTVNKEETNDAIDTRETNKEDLSKRLVSHFLLPPFCRIAFFSGNPRCLRIPLISHRFEKFGGGRSHLCLR